MDFTSRFSFEPSDEGLFIFIRHLVTKNSLLSPETVLQALFRLRLVSQQWRRVITDVALGNVHQISVSFTKEAEDVKLHVRGKFGLKNLQSPQRPLSICEQQQREVHFHLQSSGERAESFLRHLGTRLLNGTFLHAVVDFSFEYSQASSNLTTTPTKLFLPGLHLLRMLVYIRRHRLSRLSVTFSGNQEGNPSYHLYYLDGNGLQVQADLWVEVHRLQGGNLRELVLYLPLAELTRALPKLSVFTNLEYLSITTITLSKSSSYTNELQLNSSSLVLPFLWSSLGGLGRKLRRLALDVPLLPLVGFGETGLAAGLTDLSIYREVDDSIEDCGSEIGFALLQTVCSRFQGLTSLTFRSVASSKITLTSIIASISKLPRLSTLSLKLTPDQLYFYQKNNSFSSPLVGITRLDLEVDFTPAINSFADFKNQKNKEMTEGRILSSCSLISYVLFCLAPISSRRLFPNVRRLTLELSNLYKFDEYLMDVHENGQNSEVLVEYVMRFDYFPRADDVRVFLF